jgi:hypothetical protein
MYCIARRSVLPSLSKEQSDHLLAEAALHRLADLFEAVPDPRGAHGLRYDLPFLLTCLIAALLCNCDGTEAVAQWCRDHVALLGDVFGPRLFLTPSGSLYRWLLPQLDACAIERVLGKWVQATTSAEASEPLALDGKTVRGARSSEQAAPHLLAFCTHQSQETCLPSARRRENQRNPRSPRKCCQRCPCGSGYVRRMRGRPTPSSCASCMRWKLRLS